MSVEVTTSNAMALKTLSPAGLQRDLYPIQNGDSTMTETVDMVLRVEEDDEEAFEVVANENAQESRPISLKEMSPETEDAILNKIDTNDIHGEPDIYTEDKLLNDSDIETDTTKFNGAIEVHDGICNGEKVTADNTEVTAANTNNTEITITNLNNEDISPLNSPVVEVSNEDITDTYVVKPDQNIGEVTDSAVCDDKVTEPDTNSSEDVTHNTNNVDVEEPELIVQNGYLENEEVEEPRDEEPRDKEPPANKDKSKEEQDAELLKDQIMDTEDLLQIVDDKDKPDVEVLREEQDGDTDSDKPADDEFDNEHITIEDEDIKLVDTKDESEIGDQESEDVRTIISGSNTDGANEESTIDELILNDEDENMEDQDKDAELEENGKSVEVDGNDVQVEGKDVEMEAKDVETEEKDEEMEERDVGIEEKDVEIEEKDVEIEEKDVEMEEKDVEMEEKDVEMEEKDVEMEEKDVEIEEKVEETEEEEKDVKMGEKDIEMEEKGEVLEIVENEENIKITEPSEKVNSSNENIKSNETSENIETETSENIETEENTEAVEINQKGEDTVINDNDNDIMKDVKELLKPDTTEVDDNKKVQKCGEIKDETKSIKEKEQVNVPKKRTISDTEPEVETKKRKLSEGDVTSGDVKQETKLEDCRASIEKVTTLHLFNEFMRNKTVKKLSRPLLEEFCLQKMCEAIFHKSELGELRHQLGVQEQMIEMWRKEVLQLSKQARDLEIVNKRMLHEVRQKNDHEKPLIPVKITRSVGLQVRCDSVMNMVTPKRKLQPQPSRPQVTNIVQTAVVPKITSSRFSPPTSKPGTPTPLQKANVLSTQKITTTKANVLLTQALTNLSASNNNSMPKAQLKTVTSNTPLRVVPTKVPTKVAVPKVTAIITPTHTTKPVDKTFIDLTDEEERRPQGIGIPITATSTTTGVRLVKTSSSNVTTNAVTNSRIMYVYNNQLHQGLLATDPSKPGGQKLMLKLNPNMMSQTNGVLTTVPGGSLAMGGTAIRPGQQVRLTTPVAAVRNLAASKSVLKHPAPLPLPPPSQINISARKPIPPRPHLTIRRSSGGIVLSWKMPYNLDNFEAIASYQLYAYQETSAVPSSDMWRKVGDVKALALPMACTLTQFADGNKYHFAVRAVDVNKRMGQFSEPEKILL